ncbi:MAG: energy transducer TonB [Ginsengibacter sp.]
MFKHFLTICFILFGGIAVQAQTQYSYYFDNDINLVKKSRAVFVGIGIYANGLFELKVLDKKSNKLLLLEHFTDSSLQLSNGLFVSYLPNGKKGSEGSYLLGKQDGLWKKWNLAGQLSDSSLFKNGEKISENIYGYYPGGKLLSENFYTAKDNKRKVVFFDEKGKEVTPGSKEDPDKIFTKEEVEASFPGGLAAWSRYISKAITNNIDKFKKEDYGTCIIRFIVDTAGNVHDVEAINGCGKHLSSVGIEAVENGPKWIPAQQNGHLVNAYRIQPLTLVNPHE